MKVRVTGKALRVNPGRRLRLDEKQLERRVNLVVEEGGDYLVTHPFDLKRGEVVEIIDPPLAKGELEFVEELQAPKRGRPPKPKADDPDQ